MKTMTLIRTILVSFLLVLSSSCALVYEQDVQQGNVVTNEMLDNLQPGMSKAEVRYHLGTPLVEDPFHANRWDYYYTFHEGGDSEREQRVITLYFDAIDMLVDITGSAELVVTDTDEMELPNDGELNPIVSEVDGPTDFWTNLKNRILGD